MEYNKLKNDHEVLNVIRAEEKRESEGMELIASENYVSAAVLEAMANIFNNKYSEGYPGSRYYGGQEHTDEIELLAIDRARRLFGAEYINVQPLSGSPANAAVYMALLKPGDKVLGLRLDHGGHLSHGHSVNFSGMLYDFVQYGVNPETGYIDMDEVERIAKLERPKLILAGYSAYSRDLDWQRFKSIADEVGAMSMADIAHPAGLIAAGEMSSPIPYIDVITTTTHKTLRGPRGAMIMAKEKFAKDIDKAVFPGMQGGPHMHIIAAKAVAFGEALQPSFKTYAKQVKINARILADELISSGYRIISNGTDNHLMVVDMTSKSISGKEAEKLLDEVGISASRSTIPNETRSAYDPSGIRLGTAAITTRGFNESDMKLVAQYINSAIEHKQDKKMLDKIKSEVKELCLKYPIPSLQ